MKIKSIEVRSYRLPEAEQESSSKTKSWITSGPVANPMTRYPRYSAYRPSWMPTWKGFVCVVTAEDGTSGVSIGSHGTPVSSVISEYLGPRLVGESVMSIEKCYDMMVRMCAPFGATGIASYAVSAIDLALWDLKAKLLDLPVYNLIGGPARDEIRCYATGGDVEWYMELGFEGFKLPCPYGPDDGLAGLRKNVDLIATVREQIGDSVELMLDCWMAFDVENAVRFVEELRPMKLKWIEEVLRSEDFDSHEQLKARIPWQTLATGEHWYTTVPFFHAARRSLVDILQPDINWVGGLTPLLKICAIAEAAGMAVIPHGGGNTPYGQHACFSMPAIPWAECFISSSPGVPLEDASRLPGMAVPKGGKLVPTDAPGFGMELVGDKLRALS